MQLRKHIANKPIIILVILTLICILVPVSYTGRGWIRQKAIPFFGNTIYLGKVRDHFYKDMNPVNNNLVKFDFHFKNPELDECYDPDYEGIHLTLYCEKSSISNKLAPSTSLTEMWRRDSISLESQILKMGWKKDNPTQPITTLLDNLNTGDTSQQAVTYRKKHRDAECDFSIINSPSSREVFVREYCGNAMRFFGGY